MRVNKYSYNCMYNETAEYIMGQSAKNEEQGMYTIFTHRRKKLT